MLDLVALVEGPVRAHYDLNSPEPADKRPKVEAETLAADKKTHARAPSSHVPYLSEAQRDRRTVFCQRLAPDCGSRDLERFFADEHGCAVRHARIVHDKRTRKSKGVAYVEFFEEEAVKRALKLTGLKVRGQAIVVELTETEKNRLAEEARSSAVAAGRAGLEGAGDQAAPCKLYVGSLHPSLLEDDLVRVFEPFGPLAVPVQILKEAASGASKGVAFVEYKHGADALAALEALNGFELAGKAIRVGIMRTGPSAGQASAPAAPVPAPAPAPGATAAPAAGQAAPEDDELLALDARRRTELMMKLFERQ